MDAAQLPLIMDVDAILLSGLSFYFPAVADAAAADLTLVPIMDVDATASSGFSFYCASAVTAAAQAVAADANPVTGQFFSSCLKSRL